MRLFSNIISGMFHPLLMVTYGVVLALTFTYLAIYPPTMKLLLAGGAFLSTAVIPGAFTFMMVKNGRRSIWSYRTDMNAWFRI